MSPPVGAGLPGAQGRGALLSQPLTPALELAASPGSFSSPSGEGQMCLASPMWLRCQRLSLP